MKNRLSQAAPRKRGGGGGRGSGGVVFPEGTVEQRARKAVSEFSRYLLDSEKNG